MKGFALCEVHRGRALVLEPMSTPVLHYILKGTGRLRDATGAEVRFEKHDFIVVPPRRENRIESLIGADQEVRGIERCVSLVDNMIRFSAGLQGPAEIMSACGLIDAYLVGSLGLFDRLDRPLSLHFRRHEDLLQSQFSCPAHRCRGVGYRLPRGAG